MDCKIVIKWNGVPVNNLPVTSRNCLEKINYEGDPRSNANTSVISSTFGISKNGLHVYYNILSIL